MSACPVSSCNSRLIRRRSASSPFNRCRETSAASEAVVSATCRLRAALWDTQSPQNYKSQNTTSSRKSPIDSACHSTHLRRGIRVANPWMKNRSCGFARILSNITHRIQSEYMLKFFTSGESHGEALVAFISGLPAGLEVAQDFVDRELWRRQQGYGHVGRMKIERDSARILSGVRHGKTIASPISVLIENRDWKNWQEQLPVEPGNPELHKRVASPRPGHADLAGALKYNFPEARYVLERASARESAARVAIGALAKLVLRELGIEILSHVVAVGKANVEREIAWAEIQASCAKDEVLLNCEDAEAEQRMKAEVDEVLRTGDTVGGVFEVIAHGVPPGLGTYANWDE